MSYSIEIKNIWYRDNLTLDDFQSIKKLAKERKIIGIIPAAIQPVRTNSFNNFAKDFFLPTLVNQAVRVKKTTGKVFAIIGAIIFDTLTIAFRFLTVVPRVIMNSKMETHPLKKYLLKMGISKKILNIDYAQVEFNMGDSQLDKKNVNFIEMPLYPGWNHIFKQD